MAFPTTPLLDNFNRADAVLSGNWAAWDARTSMSIISNVIGSASGIQASYWSAEQFAPDCEVWATATTVAAGMWLMLRSTNPTNAATINSVQTSWDGAIFRIHSMVASVQTQIGGNIAGTLTAGDQIGLSANGDTITLWQNGVALAQRDVPLVPHSGFIAIQVETTTTRWDNFGGGSISHGAPRRMPQGV